MRKDTIIFDDLYLGNKFKSCGATFIRTETVFDEFGIQLEAVCIDSPNKDEIGRLYTFDNDLEVERI